ncbi:MAG: glycoside transferase family 32 [Prevotella sp.]|jgi:mannosyltransferase OCH1-like enzyme|nr:glycoside transferase family 32 [Prevotella sp.]
MTKIPKIIHQTWKDENLPSPFNGLAETWKKFLPDWEYILWTDEMNRNFVAQYYPHYLAKYDSYPRNIQRADAIRYLLLKTFGGLYVDADFECLENIEFMFKDVEFVAGKEPDFHAGKYYMPYIICNAFMAATPDSSFINFICDRLINYPLVEINHPKDILDSTGPFLLTNAYNDYPQKDKIRILDSKDIYPICQFEKDKILNNTMPEEMKDRIDQAYTIHYFYGNW